MQIDRNHKCHSENCSLPSKLDFLAEDTKPRGRVNANIYRALKETK